MTDNTAKEAKSERPTETTDGDAVVASIELEPTAESLGLMLPSDPKDAKQVLIRELAEAREEAGDLLDNLQRVAAEFDNFRKRTERDQIENVKRAGQRVIETLLPVLDSLDAALAIEATTDTEVRMLEGMSGTRTQLLDALERDGLSPIKAIGQPFDPALHEAVSVVPGDGDQIVEQELRKGYVMQGRVLRPTLVIVGHA
jgi:molecular chaperone GrpE